MRVSLSIEFGKSTSYYTFSSHSITNYRLWRYPIFEGKRRDRLSPSGAYRRLVELARRADIKDVSPHILRHSFVKNLVDAGVGIERVATLLGHSSLNTTRIYTTPGARDLENAVAKLE